MIEILDAPDHVGAYRLSGTLVEDDVDTIIADVEARLKRHEKVGLLADMTGFSDLGLRAVVKDIRYSLGKIGEWKRFPKEAVITDRPWLATLIGCTAPLIPFVRVKAFKPDKRAEALAWVADIPTA